MILWGIATIIGMYGAYILKRFIAYRNKRYPFYLTDCYQGVQIIISAHHFKHKTGYWIFYDGWGNVLFHSSLSWTNVYRG